MSKAKKLIICLFGSCLVAFSGLSAFAEQIVNVKMSRPEVTDTLSYTEVYCKNSSGAYVTVFGMWVIKSPNDMSVPVLTIEGNALIVQSSNVLYGYYSDLPNNSWVTIDGSGSSVNKLTFAFNSYYKITYIRTYGSIRNRTGKSTGDYTINYGSDVTIINMLNSIQSLLQQQNANTNKITSNADKNASNIQSNDDKNTQSIIDNQNQLAQQEKTETQNSGNNSVNDVSGSVPDKSAGMLSALQSLSNAVSYTGTSAKWTFPQMYIPAISGVTDRINLNPEMEIDFSYWINQIPQDIRTIISALATIGLVVFAFKELYGLISYVLTLKGGGNNE